MAATVGSVDGETVVVLVVSVTCSKKCRLSERLRERKVEVKLLVSAIVRRRRDDTVGCKDMREHGGGGATAVWLAPTTASVQLTRCPVTQMKKVSDPVNW